MKQFVLACCLAAVTWTGVAASEEREGNFTIRFEPTAKLQSATEVPFEITVIDARRKPVEQAKVKLRIKDRDNMNVQDFRATMTASGVYIAKPTFPAAGEWSVSVEVRQEQTLTARTIQFSISE